MNKGRPPMTIEEEEKEKEGKRGQPGPLTYWPGGTKDRGWKTIEVNGKRTMVWNGEERSLSSKAKPKWLVYVAAAIITLLLILLWNMAKGGG